MTEQQPDTEPDLDLEDEQVDDVTDEHPPYPEGPQDPEATEQDQT